MNTVQTSGLPPGVSAGVAVLALALALPGCAAEPTVAPTAAPTAAPAGAGTAAGNGAPAETPAAAMESTSAPPRMEAPSPAASPRLTLAPSITPTMSVTPAAAQERVNLTFRAAPVEQVFDMLSRKDNVNIVLAKGVTGSVTVNLYDVTTEEAIHAVARAAGYWVDKRGNAYFIFGGAAGADAPGASTQIRTLKVQYSDTAQVADMLAKYVSRYGKVTPLIGRRMIVVEDLPGSVARIEHLLGQIDVAPKQILIEAKILEVVLDESERFGVDWRQIFSAGGDTGGSFGTTGLAAGSLAAPTQGFFFSLLDKRLEVFLSALAAKGRLRTLSTPKLLALENQEAKAIIGDSTGYKVTTTINLVTSETIQFLESGIILKVTPSVDQRGRVLLKVEPEVSSASLNAGVPSKKSTKVTTELICEDGQSVFIGGLIKGTSTLDRSSVPVLEDLPLVGRAFTSTFESVNSSETVVIITPHIMREPRDASRYTDDKLRQMERAAETIREQEIRLQRGRP